MKVCPNCNHLYRSGIVVCPDDGGLLHTLREWQSGDTVSDRFSIIEKLGHGSLGPAFRARVLRTGGIRVLKCLSVRLADDEDLIHRFRQEVHAASALRHPNAVHVESLERSQDGRPFIVMEFVPGLSLRELLTRGGYIPAVDVVDIMGQICAVLDRAHWQGIVHRNLKPDNVIIAEEEGSAPRVKVLELGMANLRQAAAERGKQVGDVVMTDQAVIVGTMEYMSPEQATVSPTREVDGRSDLYSVGVMMFEALTGDLPMATEDPVALLRQKQEAAANEILCATVLKALQRDPDRRFQSATEMIAALREVSHSLGRSLAAEVETATGAEPVKVSVSYSGSQYAMNSASGPVHTYAPGQIVGRPLPHVAPRRPQPSANPALNEAAALTDKTIEEIRKSWPQKAGESPSRRSGKALLVLASVLGVLLASWAIYRGRGPVLSPKKGGAFGAGAAASLAVTAPDASADAGPGENPPALTVPSAESPRTAAVEQTPPPPLPGVTRDAYARPAQNASGLTPRDQMPPIAIEAKRADQTPEADSAGSMSAEGRDAEIKKKIAVGWLLIERGDHPRAIESFTEALKLDPSNVEAQAALRLARFGVQNPNVDVRPSQLPADRDVKRLGP